MVRDHPDREGIINAFAVKGKGPLLMSLYRPILTLLRDADLRRRMGEAGGKRYEALFTQERETKEYERLYLELVKAR